MIRIELKLIKGIGNGASGLEITFFPLKSTFRDVVALLRAISNFFKRGHIFCTQLHVIWVKGWAAQGHCSPWTSGFPCREGP